MQRSCWLPAPHSQRDHTDSPRAAHFLEDGSVWGECGRHFARRLRRAVRTSRLIFYDLEVTTPNISDRIDQSDNDLVYSVGVGFTFVHRFNLQLEYEILDISEFDDADAYWLNASWRF